MVTWAVAMAEKAVEAAGAVIEFGADTIRREGERIGETWDTISSSDSVLKQGGMALVDALVDGFSPLTQRSVDDAALNEMASRIGQTGIGDRMTNAQFFLPGIGAQLQGSNSAALNQSSPLLNKYSPRLFGAPPQLTHLNDMRLLSANDDTTPGPVGDFYLTHILQDAQVANFVVGRAIFVGGKGNVFNTIRMMYHYMNALARYDIFDRDGTVTSRSDTAEAAVTDMRNVFDDFSKAGVSDADLQLEYAGADDPDGLDEGTALAPVDPILRQSAPLLNDSLGLGTGALTAPLLTSLRVQQPFFAFESDWSSYMNDVKMMINAAVVMLGLQNMCVRIGDHFYPIGTDARVTPEDDVWGNYRFITPSNQLGSVQGIDNAKGDTSQYVSFMVDPTGVNESYANQVGESKIFGVMNQGSGYGNEIAFLTNASVSKMSDAMLDIAGGTVGAAQAVVSSLAGGAGRFTAAVGGSLARSFLGDHTIYPKVFQGHQSTASINLKTRLMASSGDPFSYLTDILVPLFFLLGMTLPRLSKNNAAAYTFPPLVQCNIPGMWGTRLAIIESLSVTKNQSGRDVSKNGTPMSIDIDIQVADLQHVLMTSPMNRISTFLNNHTMFDYIAQCAGVDRFRVNGSMRLVTRLALAASAVTNGFQNVGDAVLNDFTSWANRLSGAYRL
jgi:hypothetical protein